MNDPDFVNKLWFGVKAVDWRIHVFCIAFVGLFSFLGFWQLDRADEKIEMLVSLEQKRSQVPIEVIGVNDKSIEIMNGIPVFLRGQYIPDTVTLLDNVVHKGKVGFDLLVWFKEETTNRYFLVNRGFIPMARTRTEVPEIPSTVTGTDSLNGHIYAREVDHAALSDPSPLGTADEKPGGLRVQISQQAAPSFLAAGELFMSENAVNVYPHLIRLTIDDPNGLPRNWIIANISPAKHTGYAIQWFLMAFAVVVLFIRLAWQQGKSMNDTTNH